MDHWFTPTSKHIVLILITTGLVFGAGFVVANAGDSNFTAHPFGDLQFFDEDEWSGEYVYWWDGTPGSSDVCYWNRSTDIGGSEFRIKCENGYRVIAGGCRGGDVGHELKDIRGDGQDYWKCYPKNTGFSDVYGYALCCPTMDAGGSGEEPGHPTEDLVYGEVGDYSGCKWVEGSDSNADWSFEVGCPNNYGLISGGCQALDKYNPGPALVTSRPRGAGPLSNTSNEDPGWVCEAKDYMPDTWNVYAFCCPFSGTQGTSPMHPVSEVDFSVCSLRSSSSKSVNCDPGEVVFSGGCEGKLIKESIPGDSFTSWQCDADDDSGRVDTSYALCCPMLGAPLSLYVNWLDCPSEVATGETFFPIAYLEKSDYSDVNKDEYDFRFTARDGYFDEFDDSNIVASDENPIVREDGSTLEVEGPMTIDEEGDYWLYLEFRPSDGELYHACDSTSCPKDLNITS